MKAARAPRIELSPLTPVLHRPGLKGGINVVLGYDQSYPLLTVAELADGRFQILGRVAERIVTRHEAKAMLLRLAVVVREAGEAL